MRFTPAAGTGTATVGSAKAIAMTVPVDENGVASAPVDALRTWNGLLAIALSVSPPTPGGNKHEIASGHGDELSRRGSGTSDAMHGVISLPWNEA
jgi:hypothetical protein